MVYSLDQRETDLAVVELLDTVASALAGRNRLDLDDLLWATTLFTLDQVCSRLAAFSYLPEWRAHEHDDGLPCLGNTA